LSLPLLCVVVQECQPALPIFFLTKRGFPPSRGIASLSLSHSHLTYCSSWCCFLQLIFGACLQS